MVAVAPPQAGGAAAGAAGVVVDRHGVAQGGRQHPRPSASTLRILTRLPAAGDLQLTDACYLGGRIPCKRGGPAARGASSRSW
jgi:hypothetical protein